MKIIEAQEKHGTFYYNASDPKSWARAALKILTQRDTDGYWYSDPKVFYDEGKKFSDLDAAFITDEEIAAMPDSMKSEAEAKRGRAKKELKWIENYEAWYKKMRSIVDSQDDSLVTLSGGTRWEREVPRAWLVLEERKDHQYEWVSVEEVVEV